MANTLAADYLLLSKASGRTGDAIVVELVLEDHLPGLLGSVDNRLDSGCIESIVSRVYHKQSLSEAS